MLKFIGNLFWVSLPVIICYAIDWTLGTAVLIVELFCIIMVALASSWRTQDIYYTEVLEAKEVYKRGHRYAGSSMGWFEGQPVAHFAYGKWHEGTKVLFRIHYRPGAKMRNQTYWAMVGDMDYKVFMEHLAEDPSTLPPPQPVPKRPLWARLLRWLIAAPIAIFATALAIVSIVMGDYFIIWFALVIMIPAIVIFALTQRAK